MQTLYKMPCGILRIIHSDGMRAVLKEKWRLRVLSCDSYLLLTLSQVMWIPILHSCISEIGAITMPFSVTHKGNTKVKENAVLRSSKSCKVLQNYKVGNEEFCLIFHPISFSLFWGSWYNPNVRLNDEIFTVVPKRLLNFPPLG